MFWKKMPSPPPAKTFDLTGVVNIKPFWMLALPAAGEPGNPGKGIGDISGLERELAKLLIPDFQFEGHCVYASKQHAAIVAVAIMKIFPQLNIIPVGSDADEEPKNG